MNEEVKIERMGINIQEHLTLGRTNRSQEVQQTKENQPADRSIAPPVVDRVHLSQRAMELAKIKEAVGQVGPEMRKEKTSALQHQISSGQYRVPSDRLAEDLLRTFLNE